MSTTVNSLISEPSGACDCHVHIYEGKYPLAPTATFIPPHAPVAAYRRVQHELGLQRVILVQPTGYGFDNSCLLDALAQLGNGALGVCVIPADSDKETLTHLHAAGVRGVRYMMLGGLLPWNSLETISARINELGWHVNLQFDGRELPQREAMIKRLPCKVIIDHTAKFLVPVSVDSEPFLALRRILDAPDRWIKLSAPYETSITGAPEYADVSMLATTLAAAYPENCLWASNWPHPNRNPVPADADMLALLARWVPSSHSRQKILVDNPAALYGFDSLPDRVPAAT